MNAIRSTFCLSVISIVAILIGLTDSALGTDVAFIKLELAGAECETDDAGNVVGVEFLAELATEEDLSLVAELQHLTDITISGVNIGNDGFRYLRTLPSLKSLNASDTKCTDVDIKHISGLNAIEHLNLSGTAITDESIPVLLKLPKLRWVDLSSTRVTPDGLRRLRRELPKLHVHERWDYIAGIIGGRPTLDIQRATIVFGETRKSRNGGEWGGGSIEVSKAIGEDFGTVTSSGGGGSFGTGGAIANLQYVYGIPTIQIGDNKIEITNSGENLIINGQNFEITNKKLRIRLGSDGVATLLN